MLTIFTGKGKGKTQVAIGAAVKSVCRDKKVLFVDFINQDNANDIKALQSMYTLTVLFTPVELELAADNTPEGKAQASRVFRELFDTAIRTVLTSKYDMLILDGIFDAADKGLLLSSEVYEFLSNAPDSLDIICTGVEIEEKFLSLANFATELIDKKDTENEEDPS